MDCRQLPGDPNDADRFSWKRFLEAPESGPRADDDAPPTERRIGETPAKVRNATGLIVTGVLVALLSYTVPLGDDATDALASLQEANPQRVGGPTTASFLDVEIPVDD